MSAAERDAFVTAFARGTRRLTWLTLGGVTVAVVGVIALFGEVGDTATIVVTTGLIASVLGGWLRLWRAPLRELERRQPSLPALGRTAARRLTMSRVTWGNLALIPLFAGMMVLRGLDEQDVLGGWRVGWIVAAGALLIGGAVQAWRKWHTERSR